MSTTPVYIELSDDIRKLLVSKRIDLQTELRKKGIAVELRGLSLTGRRKTREPFLLILSAGVAVSLVGGAVSRIISAVSGHKHSQMKERELRPALDGNGEAIRDKEGDPVYALTEKPVEASPAEVSTTKLIAGKLLTFDMSTGNTTGKRRASSTKKLRKATGKKTTKSKG